MSGGSWDYVYGKFEDVADRLAEEKSPLRRALAKKVRLIAKAMHEIEWEDSGDTGDDASVTAIRKALNNPQNEVLEILINDAKILIDDLQTQIDVVMVQRNKKVV